jgi:predicted dehydrogenase
LIAAPNYQYADQLLSTFAHSGVFQDSQLPILVEKPLLTHLEQVQLIRQAASVHPAPVWVDMEYRLMPPLANFRRQLEAGAMGKLASLSIREQRYPFLKKGDDWNRFNRNWGDINPAR